MYRPQCSFPRRTIEIPKISGVPSVISGVRDFLVRSMLAGAVAIAHSPGIAATRLSSEIWLAPLDSLPRPWAIKGEKDYMQLFDERSEWQDIVRNVRVFKIYPQFPSEASQDQLRTLLSFLKTHNIELALETGVLTSNAECGKHVEGYNGQFLEGAGKRILAAGGQIDFVAMDEPLWFGRHYNGPNACHSPIDSLAKDVAENLEPLRAIFPHVKIGDTEPAPTDGLVPDWDVREIVHWTKAFRLAAGYPLEFVHVDMQWNRRWQAPLKTLEDRLNAEGIPVGVIFNGVPTDNSNEIWAKHTKEHYLMVERVLNHAPAQAVFQSWRTFPTKALPDTDPTTMTGIVKEYLMFHKKK